MLQAAETVESKLRSETKPKMPTEHLPMGMPRQNITTKVANKHSECMNVINRLK